MSDLNAHYFKTETAVVQYLIGDFFDCQVTFPQEGF